MTSLIGSKVERKEDKRFLTGKGRYTADINIANQNNLFIQVIQSKSLYDLKASLSINKRSIVLNSY